MLSKLISIPFIGWFVAPLIAACAAIPFYILWISFGLGAKFCYFLPAVYLNIGFWETIGIFILISYLGNIIKTLSPFGNFTFNSVNKKE